MKEENNPPRYLYRYMKDSVYAIDLLLNHELCFSHPSEFNDPYDCKGYIKVDDKEKDFVYDKLKIPYINYRLKSKKNVVTKDYKSLPASYQNYYASVYKESFMKSELADTVTEHALNKRLNELFVLCFSKNGINPTMWAHYADNHLGICLEFNPQKDKAFFSAIDDVVYKEERFVHKYPLKDGSVQDISEIIKDIVLTKYKDWQYESEVRMIRYFRENKEDKYFGHFNPLALCKIYFGYKVNERVINRYKKICECTNLQHIEFWKMGLSNDGSMKMKPYKCKIQPNRN